MIRPEEKGTEEVYHCPCIYTDKRENNQHLVVEDKDFENEYYIKQECACVYENEYQQSLSTLHKLLLDPIKSNGHWANDDI